MRIQTTHGRRLGVPDFSLEFDDAALAPHVERWVRLLDEKIAAGDARSVGQLEVLDGWSALVVAGDDGSLELHEPDLTQPRNAPPVYLRGVTSMARRSMEQMTLNRAYGLSERFSPPADPWLTLQLCPRAKWTAPFVLERSESLDATFSGWVLQCAHRCEPGRRDSTHVAPDAWLMMSLEEFSTLRAGLLRYLALPTGSLVDARIGDVEIGRRHATSSIAPTTNLAMLDLATAQLWSAFERLERIEPASSDIVPLDFERDEAVWWALTDGAMEWIITERYGVSAETAKRTVAFHMAPAILKARVRWLFRSALPTDQFDAVSAVLESRLPDEGRVAHTAAMKLREMTGKPFAPLHDLVKKIKVHLDEAARERVHNERPLP